MEDNRGLKMLFFGSSKLNAKQEKIRMLFMYLVCGVLTTVVNTVSFLAFDKLVVGSLDVSIFGYSFDCLDLINNSIAWVVSVLAAFFSNRAFVFLSKGNIWRELLSFAAARLVSFFIIEIGTFALMIMLTENCFGISKDAVIVSIYSFTITYLYLIKCLNSIILVVVNYFMSKILVFNKDKKKTSDESSNASASESNNEIVNAEI